ncbi:PVC-type heme-binding CxxCH protein [Rubritalea tangerina]|uniref:PVC-type heme-binding CxxCH protein n=1 Tax=Rubritalea tangerina TaxID=430798 RepID=A0ABW4ZGA2_9BACT
MKKITIALLGLACSYGNSLYAKKTHSGRTQANSPEQELASFEVQDGFVVELVASEANGVVNPIDISFDDAGRLWTQTARMYPMDPVKDIKWNQLLRLMDNPAEQEKNPEFKRIKDLYQGKTKGEDAILVLTGIYPGQKVKTHTFASGLAIPQSILPYKNGAFVAQGSEFFYLKDTNNDGKSDKRIPVLTGFGFTDTHTMAHCLVRGPGGWLHFTQGALNKGEITAVRSGNSIRMDYSKNAKVSLDGNKIELINAGLQNIWGYTLQANGQWFGTEANDMGWSVVPMEEQTAYKGIGGERIRSYQPWLPALHSFRVGGTGISGLAFSEDGASGFPEQWKDVAIMADPITSELVCVRIRRNKDGSVSAEHLKPLLKSKDDWFRPVHLEFGPDGCLYVVDWYNKIVSHNELPTTHPDRDKSHGRIWRIRHKSQKPRPIPNLIKTKTADLPKHLEAEILWEKRAAWHQIADRSKDETKTLIPSLIKLAGDNTKDATTRIHALWSLESIQHFDEPLISALLKSDEPELKREAVRSLARFGLTPAKVASLINGFEEDPDAMIRSQALRTLADLGKADHATIKMLVNACKRELAGDNLGGPYERKFKRFLARKALEQYPSELESFLATDEGASMPPTNLLWATQALPDGGKKAFLAIWAKIKAKPMNDSTFVVLASLAGQKAIATELIPMFANPKNAQTYVELALKNQADVQSDAFAQLISHSLEHLLKSSEPKTQLKALEAMLTLRVTPLAPKAAELYRSSKESAVKLAALKALDLDRAKFADLFIQIINDKEASTDHLRQAIYSLGRSPNGKQRNQNRDLIAAMIKQNPSRKMAILETQAQSDHGLYQLRELIDAGVLTDEDIDYNTADRMHFALKHQNSPTVQRVLDKATKKHLAAQKTAKERIPKLIQLAEKKGGNPASGKAIFTGMCLSCHQVGDEGTGIGPALDGSAKRDPEALLTAIFLPDEAAEGAYVLFRVLEKDGTIHEGLKVKSDGAGVTVAFQGGEKRFIPRNQVNREEHAGSRSFMPSGLFDALPDPILEDIMAHVRTLK